MASDMFQSITIEGFKSIRSIKDLPLRPINMLIGANGSGKSNFLGVFQFLKEIRARKLREYVARSGGADRILHFGSKNTTKLLVKLEFPNRESYEDGTKEDQHYLILLNPSEDEGLFVLQESAYYGAPPNVGSSFNNPLKLETFSREAMIICSDLTDTWVHESIDGIGIYHLHDTSTSATMRKIASLDDNRSLRSDGSNLAAFLYLLQERYGASYELIRKTIQQVAPFFEDFLLKPLALNPDTIKLEWRHKRSDQYFDASSFSDGTLRFIALATLFLQPVELRPSVILVDEPELGLHPYAIELLAAMIRQASLETQVIVATQSSLLLDQFKPEDILVADRVDGATMIRRLEPEPLKEWLMDYSLGQLWEKGELEGRPGKE
ncbi:MAG: AAA family ATPase [Terracidiphilus sp.]|jgi:predicted ATPase